MLVLAIGFLAVDKFILDPARDTLRIEEATEKGRADAILGSYGDKSVVVLAFRDMSPAHDQEYFAEGIAEELLNVLATIQDEISGNIVEQLKITLLDERPSARKIDPELYEIYLKARFIVHTGNLSQLREAQVLLDEILMVVPDYVPALNELSRVYYRIPKSEGLSREQNLAEISSLADRVVAIDPNSVDALIWQGWLADDLQESARYFEKAMSIDPTNVDLLRVVAILLTDIGRTDEAIALSNYLLVRDPSCAVCVMNLAFAYRHSGRHEEATLALEQILTWHAPTPGYYWALGVSWLVPGVPEKALATFEKELDEGLGEMGTIMALHDLGRMDEFDARFAAMREDDPSTEIIARIYAWVGNNDKAFEWLDEMVATEGPGMLAAIDSDLYEKIKSDPRWRTLRDKHGYYDKPVVAIEFNYALPPGMSID